MCIYIYIYSCLYIYIYIIYIIQYHYIVVSNTMYHISPRMFSVGRRPPRACEGLMKKKRQQRTLYYQFVILY